jgi:hypothetical protein
MLISGSSLSLSNNGFRACTCETQPNINRSLHCPAAPHRLLLILFSTAAAATAAAAAAAPIYT